MVQDFPNLQPPEIMLDASIFVGQDPPEMTEARRNATALAAANDYGRAVAELEKVRALEIEEGEAPHFTSEIRRAKYMQKAGRGAEATALLENLLEGHRDNLWTVIDVLDALRLHRQRESDPARAVHYGVAHRLARVKLYREMKESAQRKLNEPIEDHGMADLREMIIENIKSEIELAGRWLSELTDKADIVKLANTLSKKANDADNSQGLAYRIEATIRERCGPFEYLRQFA